MLRFSEDAGRNYEPGRRQCEQPLVLISDCTCFLILSPHTRSFARNAVSELLSQSGVASTLGIVVISQRCDRC